MKRLNRIVIALVAMASTAALAGCSSAPTSMPAPNLYASGKFDPFDGLPPLRSTGEGFRDIDDDDDPGPPRASAAAEAR